MVQIIYILGLIYPKCISGLTKIQATYTLTSPGLISTSFTPRPDVSKHVTIKSGEPATVFFATAGTAVSVLIVTHFGKGQVHKLARQRSIALIYV